MGCVLAGGFLVASTQTGCGNGLGDCVGVYNCPEEMIGEVLIPPHLSAPISSVTADAPCTTFYAGGDTEGPVSVTFGGSIAEGTTVSCQIHAQLSDGTEMVASVSFEGFQCCGNTAIGNPATFKNLEDGGDE